ncbi:MAG: GLUG motif-containing protein [Clostridium sp.]|nr:GLUG motif-containing protein [Clostridium sp.]
MRKNKRIHFYISIFLSLLIGITLISPVYAISDSSVIEINSPEDLLELSNKCKLDSWSRGKTVILMTDIDLKDAEFQSIPSFSGIFDGNGHEIRGFNIEKISSSIGLFRYIEKEGIVKNLTVEGKVKSTGNQKNAGVIAGVNRGTIDNCTVIAEVEAESNVGGIAGENGKEAIIRNSNVSGKVTGIHYTGGIAGYNIGTIEKCINEATINISTVEDLENTTEVDLSKLNSTENVPVYTDAGGIAGFSKGYIINCENKGIIGYSHVGYNVGGIVGRHSGYLEGCTNRGQVYGRKDVGGIVGQLEPYLTIIYSQDILQSLDVEFSKLNDMMRNTINGVSSTSDDVRAQIGTASNYINSAYNILSDTLKSVVDNKGKDLNLNETINNVNNELNSAGTAFKEVTSSLKAGNDTFRGNILAIGDQLDNIREIIFNAKSSAMEKQDNLFDDVSKDYIESREFGITINSDNYGIIEADTAVGGIAGNISIEYDIDPEEDLNIVGDVSLKYRKQAKAVLMNQRNYGDVIGKKDNIGGIAGTLDMGAIINGQAYGNVKSISGSYVGGIAGNSNSAIKNSYSLTELSGKSYLGGISGFGTEIVNCYAMTTLKAEEECVGAISGNIQEDNIENNFFVDEGIGGIDDISYEGKTTPQTYEEFIKKDTLPEAFKKIEVRFYNGEELLNTISLSYGDSIKESDVPKIEEKEGYYGKWPEFNFDRIIRSADLYVEYTPYIKTIKSEEVDESGKPVILAEGMFDEDDHLKLVSGNEGEYTLNIDSEEPREYGNLKIRYNLLGNGGDTKVYKVDGSNKTLIDSFKDGSYIVFDILNGESFIIEQVKADYSRVKAVALVIFFMAISVIICRKKLCSKKQ